MMRSWSALEERVCVQLLDLQKPDSIPLVYPSSFLLEVIRSLLKAVSTLL